VRCVIISRLRSSRQVRDFVFGLAICFVAQNAAQAYSNEAVQDAQKLLDLVLQYYAAGTASSKDVAQARYFFSQMRFKANLISRARFCRDSIPVLQEINQFIETQLQGGGYPGVFPDLINAKEQMYRVKALCQK
jgi:hypothetical protein